MSVEAGRPGGDRDAGPAVVAAREREGVVSLTLARPEIRNAMSPEVQGALLESLETCRGDADIRAVVLTGKGTSFSAGGFIKEFAAQSDHDPAAILESVYRTRDVFLGLLSFPKPIIAAVNGYALGGGFAIALCCDVVMASNEAIVGFPEIARGFVPAMASAVAMARMPRQLAREMLLNGQMYNVNSLPSTAHPCRLVPDSKLWSAALDVAAEMGSNPQSAITMTKSILRDVTDAPLIADIRQLTYASVAMRYSKDFTKGAMEFTGQDKA